MASTPPQSLKSSVMNVNSKKDLFSDREVKLIKKKYGRTKRKQEEIFLYISFTFFIHVLCWINLGKLVAAFVLYLLTGVYGIALAYPGNLEHERFKLQKYLDFLFCYMHQPSPPTSMPDGLEKPRKSEISVRKWELRDIAYASFIFFAHILCFFAPSTFSWRAFGTTCTLYVLFGVFGVTLSYHRNLAHQSFKLPKYLEYLFAYFALLAFQGDPIFWVSTHRYHHKVTDTERDPHSPIEGFMFSHIGWLFDINKMVQKGANYSNVQDLKSQPYYIFLQRTMVLHLYGIGMLLYIAGGFPYIVWGVGVGTVWGYHITFSVNSVCHTWGHQAWNTGDLSKNNWCLSLITFGESWHNNHHAFEYSARQGLEWWQIDLTWCVIKMLEYVGLATDVKLPSEKHIQRLSFNKEPDN